MDHNAKIPTSPTEAVANGDTNLASMIHPMTKEENQNPVNQSEINLNYLEELRKKNSSALLSRMDVIDQAGIENRKIANIKIIIFYFEILKLETYFNWVLQFQNGQT